MDTFNAALDFLNKAGTLGILIGIGYAVWKKHLVVGWYVASLEEQLKTCQMVNNSYATKTEAKLDKLEAERDKRYDPSA